MRQVAAGGNSPDPLEPLSCGCHCGYSDGLSYYLIKITYKIYAKRRKGVRAALAGNGQTVEGIALLRAGVAAFRATGAVTEMPFFLTLLADAEGGRISGTGG